MSFLSNLGGQLLGNVLGNSVNSAFDLNSYEKKAEIDYNYTKKLWDYQMQNKHQLEVGDLEAAGLNKILSATNGQAVSATPIGGSSFNYQSDLGTTALQLSVEQQKAEIAKTEAETNRLEAQTAKDKAESDIKFNDSAIGLNNANKEYLSARTETENTLRPLQSAKLQSENLAVLEGIERDWKLAQSIIENNKANAALSYKQAEQVAATVTKIIKETDGVMLDNEKLIRDLQDPKKMAQRDHDSSAIGYILNRAGAFMSGVREMIPIDTFNFGTYRRSN